MFDNAESGYVSDTIVPVPDGTAPAAGPGLVPDAGPVPLERLEAQICELAGHLVAATCRFLVLLGDFAARRGWAGWEPGSCAAWLSWKCQLASGTAREHVRVVRALRGLPVIRAKFGAGQLRPGAVRRRLHWRVPSVRRRTVAATGELAPFDDLANPAVVHL